MFQLVVLFMPCYQLYYKVYDKSQQGPITRLQIELNEIAVALKKYSTLN